MGEVSAAPDEAVGPEESVDAGRRAGGVRPVFVCAGERGGAPGFARDLAEAVSPLCAGTPGRAPDYPAGRVHVMDAAGRASCREAAEFCNRSGCTVVALHQGCAPRAADRAEAVLEFAAACRKPLVTTFHALSLRPEPPVRRAVRELARRSDRAVVPSRCGCEVLERIHGVRDPAPVHVPHGVHATAAGPAGGPEQPGLEGRTVLFTPGPLRRGEGIEYVIDGLPRVAEALPRVLYVVAGRNHLEFPADGCDDYRSDLREWAEYRGVRENVRLVEGPLSRRDFLSHLADADLCVLPSPDRHRIASGGLASAIGAGRAVVATPSAYAREMWTKGVVMLAGFRDGGSLAAQLVRVLRRPALRRALERRAREAARTMRWDRVARRYRELFRAVSRGSGRAA